jgi:regulator of sirC expression with transglutaminase-like and TPR domain
MFRERLNERNLSLSFLDPVSPKEVYLRMLRNLSSIYEEQQNIRALVDILIQSHLVDPQNDAILFKCCYLNTYCFLLSF